MAKYTLCWDCSKATGKCLWSSFGKPIEGWDADFIKANGTKPYSTYMVYGCPEFDRDAYVGGTRKTEREITLR